MTISAPRPTSHASRPRSAQAASASRRPSAPPSTLQTGRPGCLQRAWAATSLQVDLKGVLGEKPTVVWLRYGGEDAVPRFRLVPRTAGRPYDRVADHAGDAEVRSLLGLGQSFSVKRPPSALLPG